MSEAGLREVRIPGIKADMAEPVGKEVGYPRGEGRHKHHKRHVESPKRKGKIANDNAERTKLNLDRNILPEAARGEGIKSRDVQGAVNAKLQQMVEDDAQSRISAGAAEGRDREEKAAKAVRAELKQLRSGDEVHDNKRSVKNTEPGGTVVEQVVSEGDGTLVKDAKGNVVISEHADPAAIADAISKAPEGKREGLLRRLGKLPGAKAAMVALSLMGIGGAAKDAKAQNFWQYMLQQGAGIAVDRFGVGVNNAVNDAIRQQQIDQNTQNALMQQKLQLQADRQRMSVQRNIDEQRLALDIQTERARIETIPDPRVRAEALRNLQINAQRRSQELAINYGAYEANRNIDAQQYEANIRLQRQQQQQQRATEYRANEAYAGGAVVQRGAQAAGNAAIGIINGMVNRRH